MGPITDPNPIHNCTPAVVKKAILVLSYMGIFPSAIGLQQTFNGWAVTDAIVVPNLDAQPADIPMAYRLLIEGQWQGAKQIIQTAFENLSSGPFEDRLYYLYLQCTSKQLTRAAFKEILISNAPTVGRAYAEAIAALEKA
ncbi:MAG: hypothetical protein QM757_16610 [Paludibaculum sp.]